ncbi:hypothetical protein [Photobacterium nomapromontoriensis]|uniref:hypothetical protein n=1 Tax=Photobacterium nomapromontoriensis TaxID=2910237 RepID=UPI003D133591
MSKNKVIFHINGNTTNELINFTVTDSRIRQDQAIDPQNIAINSSQGHLILTVDVNPQGNRDVAYWYGNFVNNNENHMVHTSGGCNLPDELHFALKGILSIGDQQFKICLGQGHFPPNNHWHLCSQAILACSNNESANLNNNYFITATSHYEFNTWHIVNIDEIATNTTRTHLNVP